MTEGLGGNSNVDGLRRDLMCINDGNPLIIPLMQQGIIHVTGSEAPAFLHAQFTNAVEDMPALSSRLTAWCNAKGRVLALLRVLRVDDGYLLLLPRALVASVVKRLRMFVLRAQITIADVSDTFPTIGVVGEVDTALSEATGATPPGAPGEVASSADYTMLRLSDEPARSLILAPVSQTIALWNTLNRHGTVADSAVWRLLDIRAGLPEVVAETQERFVPQMLNLEPLGGLSYEKGCYPGQEVIARMHYLGQLKRRLFRLTGAGDPPDAGTRVTADEREAGDIVTSEYAGSVGFEALAVLRIDTVLAGNTLRVGDVTLEPSTLPYTPPGAEA